METRVGINALEALRELGQSPWYDNIERRLLRNGALKGLFRMGILGVTSNPTIFEKAVSTSSEYDRDIRELTRKKKTARQICDILTIQDVSEAADLLRPAYQRTQGLDGYVSIEVLPELAYRPRETVHAAQEIFKTINRPNIMIKVPATEESAAAIRELTREGINVNATLVFSVGHYDMCARAYIEGLKDRLKEGKGVENVFSVASVFVSRLDTKIDEILDYLKKNHLKGKSAVANAKIIYQRFKGIFDSEEFGMLKSRGANAQRVLWASTSTKNPLYRDVKYVEELIGPQTINTMPPQTVEAFLDHGKAESTIEQNLEESRAYLENIENLGIDITNICQSIQDDGVKAFQNSFDKLIRSIEQKMQK